MPITWDPKADVLLWAFWKLISSFQHGQYWFAAQCVWWLSNIVSLQPALQYDLEYERFPLEGDISTGSGTFHQWPSDSVSTVFTNVSVYVEKAMSSPFSWYSAKEMFLPSQWFSLRVSHQATPLTLYLGLREEKLVLFHKWIDNTQPRGRGCCCCLFILYALYFEYDRAPYPLRLRASWSNGGVPNPLPFVPFTLRGWHWDSNL